MTWHHVVATATGEGALWHRRSVMLAALTAETGDKGSPHTLSVKSCSYMLSSGSATVLALLLKGTHPAQITACKRDFEVCFILILKFQKVISVGFFKT